MIELFEDRRKYLIMPTSVLCRPRTGASDLDFVLAEKIKVHGFRVRPANVAGGEPSTRMRIYLRRRQINSEVSGSGRAGVVPYPHIGRPSRNSRSYLFDKKSHIEFPGPAGKGREE